MAEEGGGERDTTGRPRPEAAREGRVVRVVPEVAGVDLELAYLLPERLEREVKVGSRVRVPLGARVVPGVVVAEDREPPFGFVLREVVASRGLGPAPELVALSRWAAWRYAGRRAAFLAAASPPRKVLALPQDAPGGTRSERPRASPGPKHAQAPRPRRGLGPSTQPRWARAADGLVEEGVAHRCCVLRWPPAADRRALVHAALRRVARDTSSLVVVPERAEAEALADELRTEGVAVALLPDEWELAASGGRVVLGARAAVWGPAPRLGLVVVLGAHEEALKEERAPTWDAWVVAVERARRAGAPCLLVSPCPRVDQLQAAPLLVPSRADERAGWAPLRVVDRRGADPRAGLFSPEFVRLVRTATPEAPVLCVLNRTGRARRLACARCGDLVCCERCGGPVAEAGRAGGPGAAGGPDEPLRCRRCGLGRPSVCGTCGSQRLKALAPGVGRVEEELSALLGRPVSVMTGDRARGERAGTPVVLGTEAVLHRVGEAGAVAFLDFDQELLRPRLDAAEDALALLARAAAVVGGRAGGGSVLVQTRMPGHEVLEAALHADPGRLAAAELVRRRALGLPPAVALARVSGPAASVFVEDLRATGRVEVLGPLDGGFVVRADSHRELCDALAQVRRPPGRLRVEVDPRKL